MISDHFSSVAAGYARHRPRYPEALFVWLAGLQERRELAWDCAAGSGQASLGLTPHFRRVVATDASAAQIALAPAHVQVEYRVAPAEASGLPAASADLITVAQAAHWLDLKAFYAEVERVLAPGGALAFWGYTLHRLDDEALDARVARFYTAVVGPYWPPERRLLDAGYRTLPFPFAELAPPEFGMTAEWTLEDLLGYLGTWSAVSRCREATGRDPVGEFARGLAPLWGDPARARRVRWPLILRVGRRRGA